MTSDNISCRVQSQTTTFAEIRTPERYLYSGLTIRNRITDSSQELIIRNRITTCNPVDYSRMAAIPGSSMPSRYSSIAPPPVET